MKTTKLYFKLPSDVTGVAKTSLPGYDDVKIESREEFINELQNAINISLDDAEGTTVISIIGEWGQGKTDSYTRFIKPYLENNGNYGLFASTSTLVQLYKNKECNQITDKTNLISLKFLVNLCESIREEERTSEDIINKIPKLNEYNDPKAYMENTLQNLVGDEKKKIFVFLDEFEEILNHDPEILRDVLSGIKETINGQYTPVDSDGKFEGSLHLVIALTPEALYKFETNESINQIAGGFLSRLKIVNLKEIRRKEGIFYLKGLLENQLYYGNIPNPYPIENYGLFNTLLRVSHRNLRNLRKLFISLFKSLEKDGELEVLNYKNLIRFLEHNSVFLFNNYTPCIEHDTFYRILNYLEDQVEEEFGILSVDLFKIFIAENRPITKEYLSEKTNYDESLIGIALNIINDNISSKTDIVRPIITLSKLDEQTGLKDVFGTLKEKYIKTDKNGKDMIVIGNYTEYLSNFEDRITFFELDNDNNLNSQIYLPIEKENVKTFFEDEIDDTIALKISNRFKEITSDKHVYIASDLTLNLIYPTPIPENLKFIPNREIKLDLWRKVNKNLSNYYEKHISNSFLNLLKYSGLFSIKGSLNPPLPVIDLIDETETKFKVLIYTVNGNVKQENIEFIDEYMANNSQVHATILLYSGDFSFKASKLMSYKELDEEGKNKIISVNLHPKIAKVLICTELACNEGYNIDKELLKSEMRSIVQKELLFDSKIKDWVKYQTEQGLVVEQISTSNSMKQLADCLKLYMNYLNEPNSSEDIFKKNEENVLKFRIYNQKSGIIGSDFESNDIIVKLSNNLFSYGLLGTTDSKFYVKEHPVETKILEIIKNNNKASLDKIKKSLILKEKKGNIIKDLFINILIYKGIIAEKGKNYVLLDNKKELIEVEKLYNEFKSDIDQDKFKKYGHFFVSKSREKRLILVKEISEYVDNLFTIIKKSKYSSNSNSEIFIKVNLIKKVLEQYSKFSTQIKAAYDEGEDLHSNIQKKMSKIDKTFDQIIDSCSNRLNLKITEGKISIEEYKDLINNFNEFNEFYKKEISDDELQQLSEEVDETEFSYSYYTKDPSEAHHYNLRLYKLKELHNEFYKTYNKINDSLSENKRKFDRIDQDFKDLENHYSSLDTSEEYVISYRAHQELKEFNLPKEGKLQEFDYISLSEIEKISENKIGEIKDKYQSIMKDIIFTEEARKNEPQLVNLIKTHKKDFKTIESVFNYGKLEAEAEKFKEKILRIENEYKNTTPDDIKQDEESSPGFHIQNWIKTLKRNYKKRIESPWEDFQKENIDGLYNLKEIIEIISNKLNSDDIKEINLEIKKFELINSSSALETDFNALEIKSKMNEIKNKLDNLIKKILTEDEKAILEIIRYMTGKSQWLTYDKIKTEAMKNSLDNNSIDNGFEGLISKKILQRGFSLL